MAGKLEDHRDAVLAHIAASGCSYEEASQWLRASHGIEVTKQAIGKLVKLHRSERSDVSKAVARDHIARQLPADLEIADKRARVAGELLDKAAEKAMTNVTPSAFTCYAKAARVYLDFEEMKRKTLGLNEPDDEVVTGIVDLVGLALAEEETAAAEVAFADDDTKSEA